MHETDRRPASWRRLLVPAEHAQRTQRVSSPGLRYRARPRRGTCARHRPSRHQTGAAI